MKVALYIEDGLEQIVLTPETETEKGIIGKLGDDSRTLEIKRGSFFQTNGGWTRYASAYQTHSYGVTSSHDDESTMIVLRRKPEPPNEPQMMEPTT